MPWRAAVSAKTFAWPASSAAEAPTLSHSAKSPAAEIFPLHLLFGHTSVGFVGGKQVRHYAFQTQRRVRPEVRKDAAEIVQAHALAAHARIDLQMHRQGTGWRFRFAGGGFQLFQLPALPNRRRQLKLNRRRGLAGKNSADDQHARLGAERTGRDSFFDRGDAQPARPSLLDSRRAERQRMAISIGLDHGQQLGFVSGHRRQITVVFFQGLSVNLSPTGTHLHGVFQDLSLARNRRTA